MNKFKKIYSILYDAYGPQGWWPLTPKGLHKTKHHSGKPKHGNERFEIMLGAILTQNTAWNNVEKALEQLHKSKLVRHDALLKVSKDRIGKLIRSAGYYNQKAERLVLVSRFVKEHGVKRLLAKDADSLREMLLAVKGIGPETADSIVLYAFGKPSFVIDAYTRRIFSRVGLCDAGVGYDELQNMFVKNLAADVDVYKEYHALIVEHAKRHCRTKPQCEGCVISGICGRNI
jgi:endonuclease-3 related protein